jgi:hypothetical protein
LNTTRPAALDVGTDIPPLFVVGITHTYMDTSDIRDVNYDMEFSQVCEEDIPFPHST